MGLGSNLGNRRNNLVVAQTSIARMGTIKHQSSIYETEPVGDVLQDFFYNQVILLETALEPGALLDALLGMELQQGRKRDPKRPKGPRIIDIDILLILGEQNLRTTSPLGNNLEIPHPRITERAFVLLPLLEILPELHDTLTGKPYSSFLVGVADQVTKKLL